MDEVLTAYFPRIASNNCLASSDASLFYVYDDETSKRCFIKMTEPEQQYFLVENPGHKKVRMLAVDHCLLFDGDGKKCDCLVYDDSVLCFVELKDVGEHHDKRKVAKKDAKQQLMATVLLLKNTLPASALTHIALEAYLCVGRRAARPASRSSAQAAMRDFATQGVVLYDGCRKAF